MRALATASAGLLGVLLLLAAPASARPRVTLTLGIALDAAPFTPTPATIALPGAERLRFAYRLAAPATRRGSRSVRELSGTVTADAAASFSGRLCLDATGSVASCDGPADGLAEEDVFSALHGGAPRGSRARATLSLRGRSWSLGSITHRPRADLLYDIAQSQSNVFADRACPGDPPVRQETQRTTFAGGRAQTTTYACPLTHGGATQVLPEPSSAQGTHGSLGGLLGRVAFPIACGRAVARGALPACGTLRAGHATGHRRVAVTLPCPRPDAAPGFACPWSIDPDLAPVWRGTATVSWQLRVGR